MKMSSIILSLVAVSMFPVAIAEESTADGGLAAKLKKTISKSKRFEVFWLRSVPPVDGAMKRKRRFHGYDVLGSTTLEARDEKQAAQISAIAAGIDKTLVEPNKGFGKGCEFAPRHGLRMQVGNSTIDLLICLECGDVDVGVKRYWLEPREEREKLRTALNSPLKDAGVALADGAE